MNIDLLNDAQIKEDFTIALSEDWPRQNVKWDNWMPLMLGIAATAPAVLKIETLRGREGQVKKQHNRFVHSNYSICCTSFFKERYAAKIDVIKHEKGRLLTNEYQAISK